MKIPNIRQLDNSTFKIEIMYKNQRTSKTITTDLKGAELMMHLLTQRDKVEKDLQNRVDADEMTCYTTFKDFALWRLEKANITDRTRDSYMSYYNIGIFDAIGHIPLIDLKYSHVDDFIKDKSKEISKSTGKPISRKSLQHFKSAISVPLNEAVRRNIVPKNVAKHVEIPKAVHRMTKDKFYEESELKDLLVKALEYGSSRYKTGLILSLVGALRPGELAGLKVKDINMDTGLVQINRAVSWRNNGESKIVYPKEESFGEFRLYPDQLAIVKRHILDQMNENNNLDQDQYVLLGRFGGHIGQHTFRDMHRNFCQKNKAVYKPPYAFRHTSATLLVSKGLPLPSVQRKLRHNDRKSTEVYTHARASDLEKADAIIADIFSKIE